MIFAYRANIPPKVIVPMLCVGTIKEGSGAWERSTAKAELARDLPISSLQVQPRDFCVLTRFRIAILLGALLLFGGHAVQAASLPLFLIGFLAALSDALTSPQIARQLGGNITSSIAVVNGLLAAGFVAQAPGRGGHGTAGIAN